jgi:preprotein translocase subunit SecG
MLILSAALFWYISSLYPGRESHSLIKIMLVVSFFFFVDILTLVYRQRKKKKKETTNI